MTVSQIVKDLLEHNMITVEAATVLLSAETKANMFDKQDKNANQVFQPYHGLTGNTSNPYYSSTTTNDPMTNATTTGLSAGANELLKIK